MNFAIRPVKFGRMTAFFISPQSFVSSRWGWAHTRRYIRFSPTTCIISMLLSWKTLTAPASWLICNRRASRARFTIRCRCICRKHTPTRVTNKATSRSASISATTSWHSRSTPSSPTNSWNMWQIQCLNLLRNRGSFILYYSAVILYCNVRLKTRTIFCPSLSATPRDDIFHRR